MYSTTIKWRYIIFLILVLLLLCACSKVHKLDMSFKFDSDSLLVIATLNRWKEIEIQGSPATFLYGNLKITNKTSRERYYNIAKYYLVQGKSKERRGEVWYDGFLDYVIRDELIRADTSIEQYVYWAFPGKLTLEDIKYLKVPD